MESHLCFDKMGDQFFVSKDTSMQDWSIARDITMGWPFLL